MRFMNPVQQLDKCFSWFLKSPWSVGQPGGPQWNTFAFSNHESGGNVNNLKSIVVITKYTSSKATGNFNCSVH